jgi:hypothetical protein
MSFNTAATWASKVSVDAAGHDDVGFYDGHCHPFSSLGARGGTQQAGTAVADTIDCANSRPDHAARPVRAGHNTEHAVDSRGATRRWPSIRSTSQTTNPAALNVEPPPTSAVDPPQRSAHTPCAALLPAWCLLYRRVSCDVEPAGVAPRASLGTCQATNEAGGCWTR